VTQLEGFQNELDKQKKKIGTQIMDGTQKEPKDWH